ncbi:MAG: DUF445 family protein [Epsilonproteobacteria bacterium]|nr:DUF445 family protein [Campylobacterota bacterium]
MNTAVLASSVGIGALIGYVTNYVAIKLLFRPYNPVKIGNFTVFPQGVIPREKETLAKKVGSVVKEYILSEEEIKKIVLQPQVQSELNEFIEAKITELFSKNITDFASKDEIVQKLTAFIEKFVSEKFPMFASFVNAEMIKSVFEKVDFDIPINSIVDQQKSVDIIKHEIMTFIEKEVPKIFIKANIDKIVEDRVKSFDEKTLEDMLFSLMKKHFSFINFAGAVLGGIIGFVQYFVVTNM